MSRIGEWEPDSVEDELRAWAFSANTDRHLKGKKGQAMLRELEAALLALPERRLEYSRFVVRSGDADDVGSVCALGALALKRKIDAGLSRADAIRALAAEAAENGLSATEADEDYPEWDRIKRTAAYMGCKVNFAFAVISENDEWSRQTPEKRYEDLLRWVRERIAPPQDTVKG